MGSVDVVGLGLVNVSPLNTLMHAFGGVLIGKTERFGALMSAGLLTVTMQVQSQTKGLCLIGILGAQLAARSMDALRTKLALHEVGVTRMGVDSVLCLF